MFPYFPLARPTDQTTIVKKKNWGYESHPMIDHICLRYFYPDF